MDAPALPRWSLAALATPLAALFGWLAMALPWRTWTLFTTLTLILAAAHAATAALAVAGHRGRGRAWRVQSFVGLGYLGYLAWNLVASGVHVSALYGGLGRGVTGALAIVFAALVLPVLPLAVWGIVATGGLRGLRSRGGGVGAVLLLGLTGAALAREAHQASGEPAPIFEQPIAAAPARAALAGDPDSVPGEQTVVPTRCPRAPSPQRPTTLVTFFDRGQPVAAACLQDDSPAQVRALLSTRLAQRPGTTAVIDEVTTVGALTEPPLPPLAGLLLRPGLDGVCAGDTCFAPWQLVATNAFAAHTPVPEVPDLHFGADARALRRRLGTDEAGGMAGLTRIETRTTAVDPEGRPHPLYRLRAAPQPLSDGALLAATTAAEEYILGAQEPDGRFAYLTHPHTGARTMAGFGIPRQAGTTMALCELGRPEPAVTDAVLRSLALLRTFAWRHDDLAALVLPPNPPPALIPLGPTALSLVAFLACRPRVGAAFDADVGAMARFLLRQQDEQGGFLPRFDVRANAPRAGRDSLYAGGQALLALVLLERVVAATPSPALPAQEVVRAAVERAMDHYAHRYWPAFLRGFFFLEANWHCLAARAALAHHPHPGYERLCLDYVASRDRLVLDEAGGVDSAFVGGLGFGNLVPPQNTPTAGHGEALAAAIAIRDARGLDATAERRALARVLPFLLRNQWRAPDCFACPRPDRVLGAWSEGLATPVIRIDYVQHAWAALGHGGRVLRGPGS